MSFGLVPEHPRFYTVSPCFCKYKIWKSGKNIYVAGEKCPVGDSSNFCYSDYVDVWGTQSAENEVNAEFATGIGGATACAGACIAASLGSATEQCIQGCFWAAAASVSSIAVGHASSGDTTWGYWDYYKAADACDLLDLIGSLGAKAGAKGAVKAGAKTGEVTAKETQKAAKVTTTVERGSRSAKAINKIGSYISDVCMLPFLFGDMVMAWPEQFSLTKNTLEQEDIQKNAAECIWSGG
jgi:hypothetical protein